MITIILYIFTAVNFLIYIYIIVATASKWKVSKAHRRFLLFVILSLLWLSSVYIMISDVSYNIHIFLVKFNFSIAPLIAGMLVSLGLHFPRNNPLLSIKKELAILSPLFILSIFSYTNVFIEILAYKIYHPKPLYYVYILILIFYFLFLGGTILYKKYKQNSGIFKLQLGYIFFGYLVAILVLLAESIYSNIVGAPPVILDKFLLNTSILFSALSAFAMLRYRFMDIKIVIRKGASYTISLVIVLILYTYFALLLKSTIEQYWNLSPGWTAFILVALVALGFPPLKSLVERSINTLFKGKKSIDLAVKEVQEKMANKTDIESLIDLISQEIRKFLELEEVEILLINRQEKKFAGQERSLDFSQPMVKYLQEKGEIVVKEEISHMLEADHEFDHKELKEVENKMNKLNIAVAVPVGKGDELISLILLGKKKSHNAFTVEDIKFLERLSGQALFALGNAVLYRDAMARIKATYLEKA